METALLLTHYFYRSSINIGFERLATFVAEEVTGMVFSVNNRQLFVLIMDLYRS